MSPRSEVAWEEWEEKNLLPWLDAHRALPWKARSHAYYEQYQVDRSVESLRGKNNVGLVPDRLSIQAIQAIEAKQELIALISIHLLLQANRASQAGRCHYSALHGVKKHDLRRRFGTMYVVSVQPGSWDTDERKIHATSSLLVSALHRDLEAAIAITSMN
ncbi:unnamed protein product [Penicillium palitans]